MNTHLIRGLALAFLWLAPSLAHACQCRTQSLPLTPAQLQELRTTSTLAPLVFVGTVERIEPQKTYLGDSVTLRDVVTLHGPKQSERLVLTNGDDCPPKPLEPGERWLFYPSPGIFPESALHTNTCQRALAFAEAGAEIEALRANPHATVGPALASSAPAATTPPATTSPAPGVIAAPSAPAPTTASDPTTAASAPPPRTPPPSSGCGGCALPPVAPGAGGALALLGVCALAARRHAARRTR